MSKLLGLVDQKIDEVKREAGTARLATASLQALLEEISNRAKLNQVVILVELGEGSGSLRFFPGGTLWVYPRGGRRGHRCDLSLEELQRAGIDEPALKRLLNGEVAVSVSPQA